MQQIKISIDSTFAMSCDMLHTYSNELSRLNENMQRRVIIPASYRHVRLTAGPLIPPRTITS